MTIETWLDTWDWQRSFWIIFWTALLGIAANFQYKVGYDHGFEDGKKQMISINNAMSSKPAGGKPCECK